MKLKFEISNTGSRDSVIPKLVPGFKQCSDVLEGIQEVRWETDEKGRPLVILTMTLVPVDAYVMDKDNNWYIFKHDGHDLMEASRKTEEGFDPVKDITQVILTASVDDNACIKFYTTEKGCRND